MSDLRGRRADTGRRWGRAGRRLTEDEFATRGAAQVAKRRAEDAAVEQRRRDGETEAHARWLAGELVPHRITMYLDARGLEGPQVDERCGAHEPEVDLWEAGRLYPSWPQVVALAELCEVPARGLFIEPGDPAPLRWQDTTLRHHMPDQRPHPPAGEPDQMDLFAEPEVDDGPVLRFTPTALADAAERYGVRPVADLHAVEDHPSLEDPRRG